MFKCGWVIGYMSAGWVWCGGSWEIKIRESKVRCCKGLCSNKFKLYSREMESHQWLGDIYLFVHSLINYLPSSIFYLTNIYWMHAGTGDKGEKKQIKKMEKTWCFDGAGRIFRQSTQKKSHWESGIWAKVWRGGSKSCGYLREEHSRQREKPGPRSGGEGTGMLEEKQRSPGACIEGNSERWWILWPTVWTLTSSLSQKGSYWIFKSRDMKCSGHWFKRIPGSQDGARIEQGC